MDNRKLKVLGIGIVGFLFLFVLLYIGKYQLEDTYKLLPGDVETEKIEQDFSSWQEFTSENNYFRAYFPKVPKYNTKKISIPGEKDKFAALDIYVSELPDGTLLMVKVVRYPKNYRVKGVEQALKSTMDDLVNADNRNIVRNVNDSTFQGHPALDFSIQNPEVRLDATAVFANNSVYTLVYAANPKVFEPKVFEHFLSQFVLTADFQSPLPL